MITEDHSDTTIVVVALLHQWVGYVSCVTVYLMLVKTGSGLNLVSH